MFSHRPAYILRGWRIRDAEVKSAGVQEDFRATQIAAAITTNGQQGIEIFVEEFPLNSA